MRFRILSACALACVCALAGAGASAAQDNKAKQTEVKVSGGERDAAAKIDKAKGTEARLQAASEFVKKYPKSSLRPQVAQKLADEIAATQDAQLKISLAQTYLDFFKEPSEAALVNDILLRALMQKIYRSKEVPGRHTRVEGIDQLDKVISIDQSPIGRTPRSNPATYTGVFDHIRRLFSSTTEAKVRGYQPGRFSFNVKGGRCEACAGDGTIKIEMHFLPDVYVPCEVCKGDRYNRDTLDITFKGKNISEVLAMPCEEALGFFANQPPIARHMQTLVDVGLGYVRLGQPAPTLSGGEAQRIKLASELSKRSTGHTIYVLDEPTTGLHFEDIRKLLAVVSRLVDQGNTVIVIEHNLDVIKTSDWIIDLGPEGGDGGGRVVVEGTPEAVAKTPESYTGKFLAPLLGITP